MNRFRRLYFVKKKLQIKIYKYIHFKRYIIYQSNTPINTFVLIFKMTFRYYGNTEQVLAYLKSGLGDNYQTMIDAMSPEWRNAVYYVLSRSKSQLYLNAMLKGYEAGILSSVDPASVLAGSDEFSTKIDQLCAQ